MPDVLLLVTEGVKVQLTALMPKLGPALREATAASLPNIDSGGVGVMAIAVFATENATTMQILCVASASHERLLYKELWALNLAKAWRLVAEKAGVRWVDDVDVWPIMPAGKWLAATPEAIHQMEERLDEWSR